MELHTPQTVSVNQQYSASSLQSCVQCLPSPLMSSSAALISSPPVAANPLSVTNRQTVPANWHIKKSAVSALDALHLSRNTAANPFPDRNTPRFPTVQHSSHSDSSRHRSVKAGSTWFPTEFQTSLDCGTAKRRSVERSVSARSSVPTSGRSLNSPLKKFVYRHATTTTSSLNLSHLSKVGVGFPRNGIAAPPSVAEPAAADQPIDLSIQRRKVEPKFKQRPQPDRTQFNTSSSDEPLDLSHSSSSTRLEGQSLRPSPSHFIRPSDPGSKLPSGMIDLQNYCSRLLSGGYSVDSPLSTTASSLSFSSLVSEAYFYT